MRQKIYSRPGDTRTVYLKYALRAVQTGDPDAPEVLP